MNSIIDTCVFVNRINTLEWRNIYKHGDTYHRFGESTFQYSARNRTKDGGTTNDGYIRAGLNSQCGRQERLIFSNMQSLKNKVVEG